MLLMHLDIGPELKATVFEKINLLASDNGKRAQSSRNAIARGKLFNQKTLAYTISMTRWAGMH